jgi:hypothetical protein
MESALINIKYESPKHATMVMRTLLVDEELQPNRIFKEISTDNSVLVM